MLVVHRYQVGRQLLVDFCYLRQWITSDKLGLEAATTQCVSRLPAVTEVERGLHWLSGDPPTTPPHNVTHRHSTGSVRGYHSLPVWSEIAWYSPSDWQT